ncbi:MAG: hypothetical protein IKV80_06855 [Bacteroidales bacterium]|nr:hypothetical protein [Bacteroidales bacterium]
MGFFGWIIILAVAALICRALRSIWEAVDWIAYLLVLILFIVVWVSESFWAALLAGFLGCLAITLLFGIGSGTEVRKFGHKYTLTCEKCGYDNLEITEHTDFGVITRCRRCGQVCHHTLNH